MNLLSFAQATSVIAAIGAQRTVLISGENGIGKTAILKQLQQMEQFKDHLFTKPIDCTQLADGSIWMPDIDRAAGVSRELPNERFGVSRLSHKGIEGSQPVVIFLDEIAKAPQYVKNMLAPIIYERRIGDYELPTGSVVFAATNLSAEGLGDSIPAHQRNRLVQVNMRKPTLTEWSAYAGAAGIAAEVMVAVQQHPEVFDSFLDYQKGGKHENLQFTNKYIFNPRDAAQVSYASPRSLEAASDIIKQQHLMDRVSLQFALNGTVGEAFAAELMTIIRFGDAMPNINDVLADPTNCRLPDNPTVQTVQIFQFINRTEDRQQAEAFAIYVTRMRSEMQGLFTSALSNNRNKLPLYLNVQPFTEMLQRNVDIITSI